MILLRQSTDTTLPMGPFIDDTDGKTAETALNISMTDVRLSKAGGNMAAKNYAASLVHDELGVYPCTLDAVDLGTLGGLRIDIQMSGALPVWRECMVVPANVWDSLFSTDKLQVDTREFGDATLAFTTQMISKLDVAHASLATQATMDVLHASLSTNVGSILTDTSELQGLIASSLIAANIGGLDASIITAAAYAKDAIAATAVDADVIDKVMDEVVEGAVTFRQMMRIMYAVLAGITTGGSTSTMRFRNIANDADRVIADVDVDGNRTSVETSGA